jgi:hypothetical protein
MCPAAKSFEQAEARRLRRLGTPMKQIAADLAVSNASVHLWTRDIALTPGQRQANLRRARTTAGRAWSEVCRARRATFQAEGRARAREGDSLHLAGCMLYWAEGSKERNAVRMVNSDLHVMRLFRRFLKDRLDVKDDAIRIALNVYTNNGLTLEQIEWRWLDGLALDRSSLRKHTLDHMPTSSSGRGRSKLPYGVCNLAVHSTRLVQHIFGAIQEYGDFEEPRWLG